MSPALAGRFFTTVVSPGEPVQINLNIWLLKVKLVAQLCLTLCDPMDCSLPGPYVHGIFQARTPEWAAISFSRGSSLPRDWTQVSSIAGRLFTLWTTREAKAHSVFSTWNTNSQRKVTEIEGWSLRENCMSFGFPGGSDSGESERGNLEVLLVEKMLKFL